VEVLKHADELKQKRYNQYKSLPLAKAHKELKHKNPVDR